MVASTMMSYPLTLTHLLERADKLFGSVEIVSRRPDKSLHRCTYADFVRRSRALAETLQRLGLAKGDRVGTLMWNHYAHLEAYFGIPAAGGVIHTLNLRLHPNEIAYIVNHAEDRFLIVDDVLVPLLRQFENRIRVERILVVSLTGQAIPDGYDDYEMLLAEATGDFAYPELDENDPAGMCYTSGTTGRPKGVVYSHRALVLHSFAATMADTMAVSHRDTVLHVVPMFHANAWGVLLQPPWSAPDRSSRALFSTRRVCSHYSKAKGSPLPPACLRFGWACFRPSTGRPAAGRFPPACALSSAGRRRPNR